MKKGQLLTFIPGPKEKYASTNKIAQKAKINHYVAQRLLTELLVLDRPLVEKVDFGKNRNFILWKRTEIDRDELEKAIKVLPEERDNKEHTTVCRDKHGGIWNQYINDILKEKGVLK